MTTLFERLDLFERRLRGLESELAVLRRLASAHAAAAEPVPEPDPTTPDPAYFEAPSSPGVHMGSTAQPGATAPPAPAPVVASITPRPLDLSILFSARALA
jgi:hypothetical protein